MKRARTPRIVLDTNVAVSAFLWGGKPGLMIELAGTGRVRLYSSRALIAELRTTLAKPKLAPALVKRGAGASEIVARYGLLARIVRAKPLAPISRDPDDDHVIACAIAARADAIVSGDDDLLSLGTIAAIPVLTVAQTLKWLEDAPTI